jgi:hypothetical protein
MKLIEWLGGNLGRCSKCIRSALGLATLGWAAAFAWANFGEDPAVGAALWTSALVLTALWFAHLAAFAYRSAKAEPGVAPPSRREFLRRFARFFLLVAAYTASPFAWAQNCSACKPPFPKCVFNPARRETICCGPNTVGCSSPKKTWCCQGGRNCYGDDGLCR